MVKGLCIIKECFNILRSSKYCAKHYSRKVRYGCTELPKRGDAHYLSILLTKLKEAPSGCLEYCGALSEGYGIATYYGKTVRAHRLSWVLQCGSVKKTEVVLHSCDNRKCCNLKHLSIGTQGDNITDMVHKNRHAYGEKNGSATINDLTAILICIMADSGLKQTEIANTLDVSKYIVNKIVLGKTWSHVTGRHSSLKLKNLHGLDTTRATKKEKLYRDKEIRDLQRGKS